MTRIEHEKRVIACMVQMYCRRKEGNAALCPRCNELLAYAQQRLDRCKFGNEKPTCRQCPVHCYKPSMKEQMRAVMCWAGPRMMLYHPIIALKHLIREL